MKAEEARLLTNQNRIPIEMVLGCIKDSAARGGSMTCMPDIDDNHRMELIELGYKVSIWKDPFNGFISTKIEW